MRLTERNNNLVNEKGNHITKYSIKKGLTSILDLEEMEQLYQNALNKLGQLEDIEEWFARKRFYGKALNEPNKILELEFDKLDFRPEEDLLLIHFKVLNSWATSIFYSIFDYGKSFALKKEVLL